MNTKILERLAIYPDPILRERAVKVQEHQFNDELVVKIENMFEIMRYFNGVSLVAQQAKYTQRFIVIDLGSSGTFIDQDIFDQENLQKVEYPNNLVMINPEISEIDGDNELNSMKEGCLSLPGISVTVKRLKRIIVTFYDLEKKKYVWKVDGLLSKCVQQGVDHLNGILIIDKLDHASRKILIGKKLDDLQKKWSS